MDMNTACRMCAGLADPRVCLLETSKKALAKWIENNLGYEINQINGLPTNVCHPCLKCINNWILFCQRYKRAQIEFQKTQLEKAAEEDQTAEDNTPSEKSQPPENVKIKTEKSQSLLDKWLDKSPPNKNYEKLYNLKPLRINISGLDIKTEIKVENEEKDDTVHTGKPGPKSMKPLQIKKEIKKECVTDIQHVSKALTSALLNKISLNKKSEDGVQSGRIAKKPRPARFSRVKQELVSEEITLD